VRTMRPHIGRPLALRLEDGDVDVAVGEEHVTVVAAQLFETERSLVELGRPWSAPLSLTLYV
jgi:hypothetical protein